MPHALLESKQVCLFYAQCCDLHFAVRIQGLLKHLELEDGVEEPASFDLCDFQQRVADAPAIGVTWRDSESPKWSFAMHYLFKERLFVDDAEGVCLEDVFLGTPITIQFFYAEFKDLALRHATQQKLVWFLRHASALEFLRVSQVGDHIRHHTAESTELHAHQTG